MNRIKIFLSKIRHYNLEYLADHHPRAYLSIVLSVALLGYGVLLLFPISAFAGFYQLSKLFSNGSQPIDYQATIIWYAVTVLSISVTYHILTLKFNPKIGTVIKEKRAPQLYEFIQNHNIGGTAIRLHSIQLTDKFELRIAKIPATGIPLWSEKVLLIGFPFMQTMSKHYFDCALSARLLQRTKSPHPVTHWLAQLAYTWALYPQALRERNKIDDRLLSLFFNWYAPLYSALARYMVQHSNMLGEQYSLSMYNDQDILEAIEAQTVTEYFLNKYYWPNVIKKANTNASLSSKSLQPFAKLPTALERNLSSATINRILWRAGEKRGIGETASLNKRIKNIGHSRIKSLKIWSGTAGNHYFGENYSRVVSKMDHQWTLMHGTPSKSNPQSTEKQQTQKIRLNTVEA